MAGAPRTPETRYARNGDTHLAYQTFGAGERDVVLVPGLISHVEVGWEHPPYRRFMDRLAGFARVTVYDKRGSGLSDPVDAAAVFDLHLDDLAAVCDAVGAERPVLCGWSEGAAVCALYAAHHPDRVESLVLYGLIPKLLSGPDYPHGVDPAVFEMLLESISESWGSGVTLLALGPALLDDDAFREWWGHYERASASPSLALSALRLDCNFDLRWMLDSIHVPSLIVHRSDDVGASIEGARLAAELMPSARLVELPGDVHWPWMGDTDAVTDVIEEFVTGHRSVREPDRVLATLLVTDVVGSTLKAAEMGDSRWRDLLEVHHATASREIDAHRGSLITRAGDGLLATFDRPAAALRCADSLRASLSRHGLQIRAGVHTGEIELMGDDVGGMAVHIAARVGSLAEPGQTLASRTVRDLVFGSGIEFEPAGAHQLKGVPGEWELFEVSPRAA